ncbi:hypothetical protein BpHYR1_008660 [Brachionus plicatilis]|uniref:Uncharacterized protein n=1 Tax=Brachionus plicatilis TaxID=10195 RepID=A0A3M7TA16_BRAPC|nr:hypothetical protein BpHYR1_008660 [Brachionus plicatilis]
MSTLPKKIISGQKSTEELIEKIVCHLERIDDCHKTLKSEHGCERSRQKAANDVKTNSSYPNTSEYDVVDQIADGQKTYEISFSKFSTKVKFELLNCANLCSKHVSDNSNGYDRGQIVQMRNLCESGAHRRFLSGRIFEEIQALGLLYDLIQILYQ